MELPSLPIGIQDFEKLRTENRLYVDKTQYIHQLIQGGYGAYFFSRPRRFGKSLTVSTLKCLFEGKRHLFAGLWIEDKIDWQVYPIVFLNFNEVGYQEDLHAAFTRILDKQANQYGIELGGTGLGERFGELIQKLVAKAGRPVVVLADEYDKPLLEALASGDQAKANYIRLAMREFYGVLKGADLYLRFVFITGITRFAKVSLFSEVNQLNDITIDRKFGQLCGYSQTELEQYFASHLASAAQEMGIGQGGLLAEMRSWYNGYTWGGHPTMYNPFSILLFFDKKSFNNFWFQSGTPSLLIELMRQQGVTEVENVFVNEVDLQGHGIADWGGSLYSLLFQTGYLTISQDLGQGNYVLNYPNREVRDSMRMFLLRSYMHTQFSAVGFGMQLRQALHALDQQHFNKIFQSLFADIPYYMFINQKESYYQSIVYLALKLTGFEVVAEEPTNRGRIDLVIKDIDKIFVCEFKLSPTTAEAAVFQAHDRVYYEKYLLDGRPIYLVGIVFSAETRSIQHSIWEKVG
jgi:hypothetical protein